MSILRGDGVGIELTTGVVRGVRLRHDAPDRVTRATELPISVGDEHQALDAMMALWVDLGQPIEPTRIAIFPNGSTMQRIDVTGKTGPELAALRSALLRRRGLDSSVIVDDGPRRWLVVIGWDVSTARRVEQLAERAGFRDVAVEPSPLSVGRVLPSTTTVCRRSASRDEAFIVVLESGVPVAAGSADVVARQHPDVDVGTPVLPAPWFDELVDAVALDDLLARSSAAVDIVQNGSGERRVRVAVGGSDYPDHPAHDVRAVERQIVAVGAAAASAGLAATSRPIDIVAGADPADRYDRPWVWERVSELEDVEPGTGPSAVQRAGARFVPRRLIRRSDR